MHEQHRGKQLVKKSSANLFLKKKRPSFFLVLLLKRYNFFLYSHLHVTIVSLK